MIPQTSFKLPSMKPNDIISRYLLIALSGLTIGPLFFSILTALFGSLRLALFASPCLIILVIWLYLLNFFLYLFFFVKA